MDAHLIAALALSALIGLSLGVFGGGGSILAVPVLVYVARLPASEAIGMSLAIVGATSVTAAWAHHGRGDVRLGMGLLFGASSVVTAYIGGRLTHLVSDGILMLLFAALMIGVGGFMLFGARRRASKQPSARARVNRVRVLLAGAVVGIVTGFLGVGGGFLIVPALVAFAGLGMRQAVGTSLLVIALSSASGFVGHLGHERFDLALAAGFTLAAVAGAFLGTRAARRLSLSGLRAGFAMFVMSVGCFVLASSVLGAA